MCLTFFEINNLQEEETKQDCQHHNQEKQLKEVKYYKFILAFNRDEYINRPTLHLAPYEEDKYIYAGRDLRGKGTWLGVNIKTQIVAILTNYDTEDFIDIKNINYGRGQLPLAFLKTSFGLQKDDTAVINKLNNIMAEKDKYNAFNLVIGNFQTMNFYYICNRYEGEESMPFKLQNGTHPLCNSDYFTRWEKAEVGNTQFMSITNKYNGKLVQKEQIKQNQQELKQATEQLKIDLLALMQNGHQYLDDVQQESGIFVEKYKNTYYNNYRGTISTTMMFLNQQNELELHEYSYNIKKNKIDKQNPYKVNYRIQLDKI